MIKLKLTEYHTVTVDKTYEFEDNDILEAFGSEDAFWEAFEEESDEFWEYIWNSEYADRDEDWVSDRKGYTEMVWEALDNE